MSQYSSPTSSELSSNDSSSNQESDRLALNEEHGIISKLTLAILNLALRKINSFRGIDDEDDISASVDRVNKHAEKLPFPRMLQFGILAGVASASKYKDPSPSPDKSPSPIPIHELPEIPDAVWYGRNYLLDRASNEVVERFNLVFTSPLDEDLAKALLNFYASDVWSCLTTSENYIDITNTSIENFSARGSITKIAKYKNKQPLVYFTNMRNDTVRKYFQLIFPYNHQDIKKVASDIINSTSSNRLKDIDIRTAYVLAMRNRENFEGISKIQRFHSEVLYPEFRANFGVMAYIGPDGKHVVQNGRLRFGTLPATFR